MQLLKFEDTFNNIDNICQHLVCLIKFSNIVQLTCFNIMQFF